MKAISIIQLPAILYLPTKLQLQRSFVVSEISLDEIKRAIIYKQVSFVTVVLSAASAAP